MVATFQTREDVFAYGAAWPVCLLNGVFFSRTRAHDATQGAMLRIRSNIEVRCKYLENKADLEISA